MPAVESFIPEIETTAKVEIISEKAHKMTNKEVKEWSNDIINQLKKVIDLSNDEIIFLAGEKYRKYLIPIIKNYKIPLKGLSIGKQLKYLKERVT